MLEALLEYRTDGLILVSPAAAGAEIAADVGSAARASSSAAALRNRRVDCVMTDEALGARLAVEHLVGLGHERIVHIDGGRARARRRARAGYLQGDGARPASGARAQVVAGRLHRGGGRRGGRAAAAPRRRCRPPSSPPTTSSRSG